MAKGSANLMSRYLTVSPANNMPILSASTVTKATSGSSMRMLMVGGMRCQTMRHASMPNAMAKSTSAASTAEPGMIMRGKYTFVIRLELPTMLLALFPTAEAKYVHGSNPAYANTEYGM